MASNASLRAVSNDRTTAEPSAEGGPNAARNAEIFRRRLAGERPSEIAKAVGVTRNTVIGACFRAGLSHPLGQIWAVRGEANVSAKLTDAEVRAIRREYRPYSRLTGAQALALRYGVHPCTIRKIAARRSRVHLDQKAQASGLSGFAGNSTGSGGPRC